MAELFNMLERRPSLIRTGTRKKPGSILTVKLSPWRRMVYREAGTKTLFSASSRGRERSPTAPA